ncbi:MAG TPA: hypothetical protein VEI07_26250 [Planctomycetaceae bacterium]|nr:hypothetical protein [Planctomycetaceae bacterium]
MATPLREIRSEDLSSYAFSAFLTVGGAADYPYFLPRILELSAADDWEMPDIEVTGRAIRSCDPDSWPPAKKEALRRFLSAVIADAIESSAFEKLDGWMCAIARMGLEVAPHLEQIEKVAAAVLAYFESNADCLPQNKLCNAFWELPNASHDEIVRWFHSERIRRIPFEAHGYSPKDSG